MPTRRAVLVAALAVTVGGCRLGSREAAGRRSREDRDAAVRARTVAAERALLTAYDAVLATHPDPGGRLARLREDHAAHLAALGAVVSHSPSPGGMSAPPFPHLLSLERRAAADRVTDCLAASDPDLARLLASVAACEAAHAATVLAADRRRTGA
ncbi:MAG TPA: hypothetical protein VKP64_05670 [Mycobacteriales bacterium]|nr:hypothetical protein [Mycobacteriales bacterium]